MGSNALKGVLVVVEGIDGAGKSSVLGQLKERALACGREVVTSREPTQGPHGRRLRESAQSGRLSLREELDLFLADRRQHVSEVIAPALERGCVVVLDRYYLSSAAYQGARGADPEEVLALNEAFAPRPDLVLLLDLAPELALERIRARGSGVDAFEKIEELRTVRSFFLSLRRPFIRVISAEGCRETVARECLRAFEAVLGWPTL